MGKFSRLGFAIAAVIAAVPGVGHAQGLKINLINTGGVEEGTDAYRGFQAAAHYWESVITNDVTVNFNVGFTLIGSSGPTPTLGDASSSSRSYDYSTVEAAIRSHGNSALDASVASFLPSSDTINGMSEFGGTDFTLNNTVAKALGLMVQDNSIDASIRFNTAAAFDFNTNDGFAVPSADFISVAVHEMGHALGFTSGVDGFASFFGGTNLDLFRYGSAGNLEWDTGDPAYFSIDGGASQLFGRSEFESGATLQASHWLDAARIYNGTGACSQLLEPERGIMNPTGGVCQQGIVTALDLATFDALGWNLDFDVLAHSDYTFNTAQIAAAIPEPASWAMMIGGFGLVGGMVRRRRRTTVTFV